MEIQNRNPSPFHFTAISPVDPILGLGILGLLATERILNVLIGDAFMREALLRAEAIESHQRTGEIQRPVSAISGETGVISIVVVQMGTHPKLGSEKVGNGCGNLGPKWRVRL